MESQLRLVAANYQRRDRDPVGPHPGGDQSVGHAGCKIGPVKMCSRRSVATADQSQL